MNPQIQPFHFTKAVGNNFLLFFNRVLQFNGLVCFDFEDSVNCQNPEQLPALKQSHRERLLESLQEITSELTWSGIGFRVNRFGSPFFPDDLKAISRLQQVHSIFAPKVESVRELEGILQLLPQQVNELIPVIETRKGFENIKQILAVQDKRFIRFAFGHCDFNLSNNYFPFFHQQSAVYWNWISELAYYARMAGKQLINSPVLQLDNDPFFRQVLRLNTTFSPVTGQVTLCLKQTALCAAKEDHGNFLHVSDAEDHQMSTSQASQTVQAFEEFKVSDRFFAIDPNRNLVSPQEYSAAKTHLKQLVL